jgi:hypothetical protein
MPLLLETIICSDVRESTIRVVRAELEKNNIKSGELFFDLHSVL